MNGSFMTIMMWALGIFIGAVVLFAIYIIIFPAKPHKVKQENEKFAR